MGYELLLEALLGSALAGGDRWLAPRGGWPWQTSLTPAQASCSAALIAKASHCAAALTRERHVAGVHDVLHEHVIPAAASCAEHAHTHDTSP